jgi:PhnB protein
MKAIHPYLFLGENCRDAMNFYADCFGVKMEFTVVGETPMAEHMPPDKQNAVMHCELHSEGQIIMANGFSGPEPAGITIACSDKAEVDSFFQKLSAGGTVTCPPGVQFWGDYFASFADKFGIQWMLSYREA